MKDYNVRYWIKAYRTEVEHNMFVTANNAKDACAICKALVKEKTGRNAFRPVAKRIEV